MNYELSMMNYELGKRTMKSVPKASLRETMGNSVPKASLREKT